MTDTIEIIYKQVYLADGVFDIIPVGQLVRCKDCKHWDNHDGGERCLNTIVYLSWAKPNSFCSYGERKDKV